MTTDNQLIRTHHDPHHRWALHQGDVTAVVPALPRATYAGILTDPPYGLGFMEKDWDAAIPPVAVWSQLLRACKPGAFLLAFGGTKTFHRLACHIQDAGWEIRDTLLWLYGEGFPKGQDISKAIDKELGVKRPVVGEKQNRHRGSSADHRFGYSASAGTIPVTAAASDEAKRWDGYSTALKPAWEPIILAQKPRRGNFAQNAIQFGCGGLNIGGSRIGSSGGTERSHQAENPRRSDGREDRRYWERTGHSADPVNKGRWPANVILDEKAAAQVDRRSGPSRSRRGLRRHAGSDIGNGSTLHSFNSRVDAVEGYDDEGGASRFFYSPKARGNERKGNDHPTVKPLALCEYLARLVLPPEGRSPRRLLVPFSGSGSEMIGALAAGWDHVTGIECDAKYVEIARRRLTDFGDGLSVRA